MSQTPPTKAVRILFVDDEERSRKYFSMIFGKTWDVVLAGDGKEALEILLGEKEGQIAVIVTDQIMPRMTGIEMLERIRHLRPNVVKVLSTAYADSELVANAAKSGTIDYFIGKPWMIEKLRETLEHATAHHQLIKAAG